MSLLIHPYCFVCLIWKILNGFYCILTFHFEYQILYTCKLASLSCRKSTQVRERAFSIGNEWNKLKMRYFQSLKWKLLKSVGQWTDISLKGWWGFETHSYTCHKIKFSWVCQQRMLDWLTARVSRSSYSRRIDRLPPTNNLRTWKLWVSVSKIQDDVCRGQSVFPLKLRVLADPSRHCVQ